MNTNFMNNLEEASLLTFQTEYSPISSIYVDMEYLQDLKLGTILSKITVQKEMEYILHCLPKYNARYEQATGKYFPVLRITDEEIMQELKSKNSYKICAISPFTNMYKYLISSFDAIRKHNKQVSDQTAPLRLTVNVADVEYPDVLKRTFIATIKKLYPDIVVEFTDNERYKENSEFYKNHSVIMLYDYGAFLSESSPVFSDFTNEGSFLNNRIIAHPYIDTKLGHDPDKYAEILASTEIGLDMYCDFCFVPSLIDIHTGDK